MGGICHVVDLQPRNPAVVRHCGRLLARHCGRLHLLALVVPLLQCTRIPPPSETSVRSRLRCLGSGTSSTCGAQNRSKRIGSFAAPVPVEPDAAAATAACSLPLPWPWPAGRRAMARRRTRRATSWSRRRSSTNPRLLPARCSCPCPCPCPKMPPRHRALALALARCSCPCPLPSLPAASEAEGHRLDPASLARRGPPGAATPRHRRGPPARGPPSAPPSARPRAEGGMRRYGSA